jgi:hypothetical protein
MNKNERLLTEPDNVQVKRCRGEYFAKSVYNVRSLRGVSLFEKIPFNRTCKEAMTPFIYCNCKNETDITALEDQFLQETRLKYEQVFESILKKLNSMTEEARDDCEEFVAKEILSIRRYLYNSEFVYMFEVGVMPGAARFQVHFKVVGDEGSRILEFIGDLTRTTRYREQALCVDGEVFEQYCVCTMKALKALEEDDF